MDQSTSIGLVARAWVSKCWLFLEVFIMCKVYIRGSEKLLVAVAAGVALVGAFAVPSARATLSISAAASSLGVSTLSPAPSGYVFFKGSATTDASSSVYTLSPLAPTSYATLSTGSDNFYSDNTSGYSSLAIGSSPAFTTGVAYQSTGPSATTQLLSITFGTGTPGALKLGLLEDNGNGPENNEASVTVQDAANISNEVTTLVAGSANPTTNDFYYFDLSGLSSGEQVNVLVTSASGASNVSLGGVTFDAAPEPTTLGLLALGGLGLLLLARKRAISLI